MSKSQDLPGFYYDEEKRRYFKVQKHEVPGFVTQTTVSLNDFKKRKLELARTLRTYLEGRRELSHPLSRSLIHRLNCREIGSNLCAGSVTCTYGASLRYRQSLNINLNRAPIPVLFSSNGYRMHVLESLGMGIELRSFRIFWKSRAETDTVAGKVVLRRSPKYSQFKLSAGGTANLLSIPGLSAIDMIWSFPNHRIALLGKEGRRPVIGEIRCSGTSYNIAGVRTLPLNTQYSAFATPVSVESSGSSELYEAANLMDQVAVLYNDKELMLYDGYGLVRKYIPRQRTTNPVRLNAVCLTRPLVNYFAEAFRKAPVYMAFAPTNELNLVCLYCAAGQKRILLRFAAPKHPSLHPYPLNNRGGLDITHIQCLSTSTGDRVGVITCRRNGLLQLWDDRWPCSPAVEYYGSGDGYSLPTYSCVPIRPYIEPLKQEIIVSPFATNSTIGMWEVKTGKLLNTCKLPVSNGELVNPPTVVYRDTWPTSYISYDRQHI